MRRLLVNSVLCWGLSYGSPKASIVGSIGGMRQFLVELR
jgi:hypothetical protein